MSEAVTTPLKFRTTLLQGGKTATGIEIPPRLVEALAAGKRPPVRVTINGFTYRSTVAVMGGRFMVGVSAERREAAGVKGGDEIEVEIALDDAPREIVVPEELAAALGADPVAAVAFAKLSNSAKLRHTLPLEAAKAPETRARRVAKTLAELKGEA